MRRIDVMQHSFDVVFVCFFSVVNLCHCQHKEVAAHTRLRDESSCFPDECDINEFCCDGECCSNFARNWFAWTILMLLIFTIIVTCLCVPRISWTQNTVETIPYHLVSTETYQIYNTTPYRQQPTIPQYHSLATEKEFSPHQPFRYERLVQQTSSHFDYPEPSAPPKSP